jgi:hypothetical protein
MDRRKARRTKIGGAFAPRLVEMLESPAYRALSLSGHRVLARVEIELGHHGGTDNGRLPVTFEHFLQYGINRAAISPAIRECIALGFLTYEKGAAGNAEFRRPNLFGLTYRHTARFDPTDDWRAIKTNTDAAAIADTARAAKAGGRKKQKASAGKQTVSVSETSTETPPSPVLETSTTVPVLETSTTSISREGADTPKSTVPPTIPKSRRATGLRPVPVAGGDDLRASLERVIARSRQTAAGGRT